ncbi:MAG: pilus assembly protein PilM, partial [Phycisphaerales bacterium JB038]
MAVRGAYIAVECTRLTLSAVEATLDGSGVRIRSALHLPVPADLDTEDTARMGGWVAGALADAGIAARRAVLVVPRSSVVLKKLTLPRPANRHDIPDLVHLAMTRQLTFGAKDAVVDYLELDEAGAETGGEFSVLAAAVAGELLAWHLAVAKAAGLRPVRVGLRSGGLASLLIEPAMNEGAEEANPQLRLAAEVDRREIGMIVMRGEEFIFARATELSANGDAEGEEASREAHAAAIATEVRRTWMSYRVTADAGDIERAFVIGEHALAAEAAAQIQESIGVPTRVFDVHPQIHAESDLPPGGWPLAGSLLREWGGRPTVNFAKPRKAPDRRQALRQRALLVLAALIIVVGSAEVLIRKHLASLRGEYQQLYREVGDLNGDRITLLRQEARLRHLQ